MRGVSAATPSRQTVARCSRGLAAAERRPLAYAEQALLIERRLLQPSELEALSGLGDDRVVALAALAHEVRLAWSGATVEVEGILPAKTGGCPEDCHFWSQSSRFDSPVKATAFSTTTRS